MVGQVVPGGQFLNYNRVFVFDPGLDGRAYWAILPLRRKEAAGNGALVEPEGGYVDFQLPGVAVSFVGRVVVEYGIEHNLVLALIVLESDFRTAEVVACTFKHSCRMGAKGYISNTGQVPKAIPLYFQGPPRLPILNSLSCPHLHLVTAKK